MRRCCRAISALILLVLPLFFLTPCPPADRKAVASLLHRLSKLAVDHPEAAELDLSEARTQVEEALQATTDAVAQVTHLLALVSAPGLETASVRHVEVLLLQPSVVMVVTITSTGGVAKKLAEETGGRVISVSSEKKLREAFNEISEELRSQYTLGYYPTNSSRDGKFRKIKIEMPDHDLKVLARKGYYAPKG